MSAKLGSLGGSESVNGAELTSEHLPGPCPAQQHYVQAAHLFKLFAFAGAGKMTIVEVEREIVEIGELDPDSIHFSGYLCQSHYFKCKS